MNITNIINWDGLKLEIWLKLYRFDLWIYKNLYHLLFDNTSCFKSEIFDEYIWTIYEQCLNDLIEIIFKSLAFDFKFFVQNDTKGFDDHYQIEKRDEKMVEQI